MINTIIKAAENFCIHQIRVPHTVHDDIADAKTLIAYIDIETNSMDKYRIYLSADKAFMQRISFLFLEENESNDDTLKDILLETLNLIVGSAKVLSEDTDSPFSIKTPHFEKNDLFDLEYDMLKTIQVQDDKLSIAIKEIN